MKQGVFAKTAIAAVLAGTTLAVQSLGLGEINVSSNLNQRFQAVIPLSEISLEDLESVKVSVAPNEDFDRAGLERAEYLTSLRFAVKGDGGNPRIVVTSGQIAREPVVNLLVQARWRGGKILREYTVLLDPPTLPAPAREPAPVVAAAPVKPSLPAPITMGPRVTATPPPVVVAPQPAPVIAPPSKPLPPPVAVEPPPPPPPRESEFFETSSESRAVASRIKRPPAAPRPLPLERASGRNYGPIKPGETLWRVATNTRPSSTVSMEQMMLALVEANPGTILKGITLSTGTQLRVPSLAEILSYSPRAAKERLAAIQAGRQVSSGVATPALPAPAKPVAPVLAPTPKPLPAPAVKPAVPPPPPAAVVPAPAVKPSPVIAVVPVPAPAPIIKPLPEAAAPPAPSAPGPAVKPAELPPPPPPAAETAKPASGSAIPAAGTTAAKSGLASYWPLLAGAAAAGLLVFLGLRRVSKPDEPQPAKPKLVVAPPPKPVARTAATVSPPSPMRAGDTSVRTARELAEDHTPFSSSSATGLATDFVIDTDLGNTPQVSVTKEGRPGFEKVKTAPPPAALADNDPLADADFHLAYGLHDEAISVLSAGIRRFPARNDLKLKLAETYFAAGNSQEFLAVAETLKDKLPASDWGKLVIMGSQLAPGAALFKGSDLSNDTTDFDIAFEEPAPAPAPAASGLSLKPNLPPPPPPPTIKPVEKVSSGTQVIAAAVKSLPFAVVPPQESDDIDFMLGQSIVPMGMNTLAPAFKTKDVPSEFNLGVTSLNIEPSASDSELPSLDTDLEISLQSLQVSLTPREVAPASDDELNTKLDLARAYVEMGDHDSARGLLKEVQEEGGDQHRKEADALMQRLPA